MDTNSILTSSGISTGLYILYKLAQRYYFRSGCHNRTLEIVVVDREEEKQPTIELPTLNQMSSPPPVPQ